MEIGEIFTYIGTALGAGGVTQFANWKWNKRKEAANTKIDEIEVIRKTIEDVYKPTIELQNSQINDLRQEVHELRKEVEHLRKERNECRDHIADLQAILDKLTAPRPRNRKGQYVKTEQIPEEPEADATDTQTDL